ncbi:MAG: FMN-binding negative transcriptional regulator [Alphaproteobacteria bacterium]|nr:FMN-binding negative transcriptional regulator [Alphaproteobacteria bacterium]
MYQPAHHREDGIEAQHDLIRAHPLGLLVSAGPGGLMANLAPFLIDPAAGARGTLRCHLARANPQWRDLAALGAQGGECLVAFQGAEGYVTPSWYATKRETGKVVPTWNYVAVQVRGTPRVVEDAAWLRALVEALTATHEAGRAAPWKVSDAPDDFIAAQLRGIVGVEIPIARSEGKWKVSQNRPAPDRAGVVEGLRAQGASGEAMAALVAARGGKP